MEKIILTATIAAVIALAFIGTVIKMIVDKKKGKRSCSCGGNCGACGLCHVADNGDKSGN